MDGSVAEEQSNTKLGIETKKMERSKGAKSVCGRPFPADGISKSEEALGNRGKLTKSVPTG